HVFGGIQRSVAGHEGYAAGIAAQIDWREFSVCGDELDALGTNSENFSGDLNLHGIRALANFRRASVESYGSVAIDFDVHRGVRHVRTHDGIGCAADVMAASDADAFAVRQLVFLPLPARALENFLNAFGQAVAGDAQRVGGDARRLQQITTANFNGIDCGLISKLIEHGFKCETNVHSAVAAHGAAGGLVGEHTKTVVADVGNVIDRTEKRARIKHSDRTVAAIRAAILNHASLHRGDFSRASDADL